MPPESRRLRYVAGLGFLPVSWGGRRGVGRWELLLTSLTEWTFVVDFLPRGSTTLSDEYRALHREARSLAKDGIIQMVTLRSGSKRAAVGPVGLSFDLGSR